MLRVVARAFWRLLDGVVDGAARAAGRGGVPGRRVEMVRDPVCGTFVDPRHAVAIVDGRSRVHFCSAACRDAYRARTA
jgi:YHS domain-containing protein